MADVVLHAVLPRLLIKLVRPPYAFYLPGGVTNGFLGRRRHIRRARKAAELLPCANSR